MGLQRGAFSFQRSPQRKTTFSHKAKNGRRNPFVRGTRWSAPGTTSTPSSVASTCPVYASAPTDCMVAHKESRVNREGAAMESPYSPKQNHLLASLPAADHARLLSELELVPMPLGWSVYESGGHQGYVYFPTDCIVSLLYVMENGSSAEMAVTGNEGVVGIALFMGGETTPSRAVVQSAGHAYRLKAAVLKREIRAWRRAAAPAAALHAGTDHADVADRGVQPAPFGGAAAVPLAVVEHGPPAGQ